MKIRGNRRPRLLLTTVLYVFTGVFSTIAISWVISLWSHPQLVGHGNAEEQGMHWMWMIYRGFGIEREFLASDCQISRGSPERPLLPPLAIPKVEPGTRIDRAHVTVGLPFRCLRASTELQFERSQAVHWWEGNYPTPRWRGGLIARHSEGNPLLMKVIPYRILPVGFTLNTAFYAVVVSLVVALKRFISHTVRHKRGLCSSCRYDLRHADHPVCPECGTLT